MGRPLPVAERPRRPEWMRSGPEPGLALLRRQEADPRPSLHTICEEAAARTSASAGAGAPRPSGSSATPARAPAATATSTAAGPTPAGPLEPLRLANAAAQIDLKHVVVTSVDRDDVPDRGAGHYTATIRALKKKLPEASVEVLTPDFLDVEEGRFRPSSARGPTSSTTTSRRPPPALAHAGAKASYDKALWLLQRAKEIADYPVLTKSGMIVGLGETNDEVVETMRDLRAHDVDVVTIGQYLQPSSKHAQIDRWVHPDEFRWFREQGEALGFGSVFSGPLVRSSYRADEQRHAAETGRGAVADQRGEFSATIVPEQRHSGMPCTGTHPTMRREKVLKASQRSRRWSLIPTVDRGSYFDRWGKSVHRLADAGVDREVDASEPARKTVVTVGIESLTAAGRLRDGPCRGRPAAVADIGPDRGYSSTDRSDLARK